MIKIKLNDLLDIHEITITDFSKDTGLARSTITPLVNRPGEVKAIKIETLNVICDYFGISIDELIEFIPDSNKYVMSQVYDSTKNDKVKFLIFKKNMGNSERYSILSIRFQKAFYGDETSDGLFNAEISVLENKEDLPSDFNLVVRSKIIPGNVFLKDFKRQSDEKKIATTKLIAKAILSIPPLSDYPVLNHILLVWDDFPFFEKHLYTYPFDIYREKNDIDLVYSGGFSELN